MPDIAAIAAVLNTIKTATDIVKFIRETDTSLEKAELKMKLADLVCALADARIQAVDAQDELAERDCRIKELEEALETKMNVARHYDGYYMIGDSGQPSGRPYCLSCWNQHHKLRELVQDHGSHVLNLCASCGHRYPRRLTPYVSDSAPDSDA